MGNFQHYVPRVYLQGFTDSSTPPGQEPYVWVWDMQERTVKRRSPRNVAGENEYYESLGVTAGPGAGLESRLARIESRFRSGLEQLLSVDHPERGIGGDLSWFLATLSVRTPWGRNAVENHSQDYPPTSGGLLGLSEHETWAASVEYLAWWVEGYFRRMEWVSIRPPSPESTFCTSDRPVVLTGNHMDGSIVDVLRLTETCSIATVPLTSRLALIGSYNRAEFLREGVTVGWFNDRVVKNAERFIFQPHAPT